MFKQNEETLIDNAIDGYIKEHWRYPTLEQLCKVQDVWFFFNIIRENRELTQAFNEYLLVNFDKRITSKQNVKMRKKLAEAYKNHKNIFQAFFLLNLDRENLKWDDFHKLGEQMREIIENVQTNIVWNLESWRSKYGVFSNSINDKFLAYLKEFFPLYDNIWLKIKKINT